MISDNLQEVESAPRQVLMGKFYRDSNTFSKDFESQIIIRDEFKQVKPRSQLSSLNSHKIRYFTFCSDSLVLKYSKSELSTHEQFTYLCFEELCNIYDKPHYDLSILGIQWKDHFAFTMYFNDRYIILATQNGDTFNKWLNHFELIKRKSNDRSILIRQSFIQQCGDKFLLSKDQFQKTGLKNQLYFNFSQVDSPPSMQWHKQDEIFQKYNKGQALQQQSPTINKKLIDQINISSLLITDIANPGQIYLSKLQNQNDEQIFDTQDGYNMKIDQPDQQIIQQKLQKDQLRKIEFLESEEGSYFSQVLVVSQIRMDQSHDDLFISHLVNMKRALKKSVKGILLQLQHVKDKDQFKKQISSQIIKIFYQDINIGFITSTGQIKSTAFVYVNRNMLQMFNRKEHSLQFKKIPFRVTLHFFTLESLHNMQPTIPDTDLFDVQNAFFRNNKFCNEFLVLSQMKQDELKQGISIFFVYRPIDDQIYAVKRSKLATKQVDFFDVFTTGTLNQSNGDQLKIREAKILSKLTHPNILRLYDWWFENTNDSCFLYMQLEYCSFPGFRYQSTDLLTFAYFYMNPMTNKQKIESIKNILSQILDALEYIHKRGIVHRDLKPENVFVTINVTGALQVVLADFDQGKDVRELKLSTISDIRLSEQELNSVKSLNTIKSGTAGYQTQNSNKDQCYDQRDEFFALGITLLHLVITFPGEPKNRNHYAKTFSMSDPDDVLTLFDNWASKFVKNRNPEFAFEHFRQVLKLAKILISKQIYNHQDIKEHIMKL